MAERSPTLAHTMIPRKGTAAFEPVDPAAELQPTPQAETPAPPPALVTARPKLEPIPPPPPRTSLTYRPTVEMHEWLKEFKHGTRRSIQDLIDEALKRFREDHA